MASTIRLDKFVEHPPTAQNPDTSIEIVFTLNGAGGQGRIWSSRQAMLDETVNRLADDEHTIAFLVGYCQGRDADFSNPATVMGKLLTVDFSAPQPIKVN